MKRLLYTLLLLSILGTVTQAQATPHQTPLITQTALASEPVAEATPEGTAVIATTDAPYIVTVEAPGALDRLTVIFLAAIGVAGAVAGTGIWRLMGVLITLAEVLAFITPDKKDDVEVAKWRAAYDEKMAAQAAAEGVRSEIEREKAVQQAQADLKAAQWKPLTPDLNDPKLKG